MRQGLLWLALVLLLAPAARATEFKFSEEPLVKGKPVVVTVQHEGVPLRGAIVQVTYRAGSVVERTVKLPALDADGCTNWTPEQPGITTLEVTRGGVTASYQVAIRFATFPIGGLAVFLFAGTLLFGGVILGFRRLMRS